MATVLLVDVQRNMLLPPGPVPDADAGAIQDVLALGRGCGGPRPQQRRRG